MNAVLDRVANALFASDDHHRVANVKFFRGTCSTVTAEQLASQLESADTQVESEQATRVDNIDNYQPASR